MGNNEMDEYKQLSPEEVITLRYGITSFFQNHSLDESKNALWNMYSGWVYDSAQFPECEEIRVMLYFYQELDNFLMKAHQYCRYLDEQVLRNKTDA